MSGDTEIELHSKRLTDLDIRRLIRASKHFYEEPVTAYLSDVFVHSNSAVGIVYGHIEPGPHGRFADGHFLRTSDIRFATKEGRFWVLTTLNSRYVVASFRGMVVEPASEAFYSQPSFVVTSARLTGACGALSESRSW